jgi:hypothetical protein
MRASLARNFLVTAATDQDHIQRMTSSRALLVLAAAALPAGGDGAEIERIWLSHAQSTPETMVVNWETAELAESVIEFGTTPQLGDHESMATKTRLHHVEIPLPGAGIYYRARSGKDASAVHFAPGYAEDELRVAIIADTGYAKANWGESVLRAKPHLLLSAGDNVGALHKGAPVDPRNTEAFSKLIDRWPELFRTTRFMPALGNHDREIRPRGPKPPPEPVYDVEAKAFRDFFALPGEEWRWHFDLPDFGARFVALDLNHLSDMGTTWQTCHPFAKDGPQFGWYRDLMAASEQPFVITIYNERNATVRGLEKGEWGKLIAQGSMAVTGFGYFAERAEVDGFPCYNISVSGTGAKYPDPQSAFFASEDNFLLVKFPRDRSKMTVELRNLDGTVLDTKAILPRKIRPR